MQPFPFKARTLAGAAKHLIRTIFAGLALVFAAAAAAQPVPDQVLTAAATAPGRYQVHLGDELDVFVWGEERMQRVVKVQPDGTFSFPLAGTILAVGRGVGDIATDIRERISVNYRAAPPDVTVSVRTATDMRFYVVGKVRTPGSFTSGSSINILQALSMAGGPADFADLKNAVVLRQTAQGQIVERIQLNRLLKGGKVLRQGALATPLPTLSSGDVLVVP